MRAETEFESGTIWKQKLIEKKNEESIRNSKTVFSFESVECDEAMSPTALGAELPQWCGKAESCPQALLGWLYLTPEQNDQVSK